MDVEGKGGLSVPPQPLSLGRGQLQFLLALLALTAIIPTGHLGLQPANELPCLCFDEIRTRP